MRYLRMPGSDIFTRRRVALERHWQQGPRDVLDAGFGNGWFSYRAWRSGARVLGVANQDDLVVKARSLYNGYLDIPEPALEFRLLDLYQADSIDRSFDEIICYETLEHIKDDEKVCRLFHRLLKPGGVLHLCCPNADHPRWRAEKLDDHEAGGHVRHGYTVESYRRLLEPIGWEVKLAEGIGGRALVFVQEKVQAPVRKVAGEAGAYAISLLSAPLVALDDADPTVPFSIYIKATK